MFDVSQLYYCNNDNMTHRKPGGRARWGCAGGIVSAVVQWRAVQCWWREWDSETCVGRPGRQHRLIVECRVYLGQLWHSHSQAQLTVRHYSVSQTTQYTVNSQQLSSQTTVWLSLPSHHWSDLTGAGEGEGEPKWSSLTFGLVESRFSGWKMNIWCLGVDQ